MAVELEHVRRIAERVAASQGVELVDLEFRGGPVPHICPPLADVGLHDPRSPALICG
jgi:hypothetical protein